MNDKDIGWFAGIVDGEGHIGIRTKGDVYLQISNTYKEAINKCLNLFPNGTYVVYEPNEKRGYKTLYLATWNGRNAQKVLKEVIDILVIKQKQARIALSPTYEGRNIKISEKEELLKKICKVKLRKLNKKRTSRL